MIVEHHQIIKSYQTGSQLVRISYFRTKASILIAIKIVIGMVALYMRDVLF